MKKRIIILAAVLLAIGASAQASVISVNMDGFNKQVDPMAATEVAGLVPSANWNAYDYADGGSFQGGTPVDDSGVAVAGGFTVTSTGGGDSWNTAGTDNRKMFGDFANGTKEISNIPYAKYDIIVYSKLYNTAPQEFSLDGGTTVQTVTNSVNGGTQAPQNFDAAPPSGSNGVFADGVHYTKFSGLTGTSQTLNHGSMAGFQIVEFSLTSPANGDQAVDPITTTELSWILPEVDTKVTVWFEAVGDQDTPIVDGQGETSITLADAGITLAGGTNYTWRIKMADSADAPISDITYTFETSTANRRPTVEIPDFYSWLEDDGSQTVTIDSAVITDSDGTSLHTYTWSVAADSEKDTATFAPAGPQATAVTAVTFNAAGDYILELKVDDSIDYSEIGTVNVTVYADGCASKINEDGYDAEAARQRGDFNHDCNVNLDDLTKLASKWLQSKAL